VKLEYTSQYGIQDLLLLLFLLHFSTYAFCFKRASHCELLCECYDNSSAFMCRSTTWVTFIS